MFDRNRTLTELEGHDWGEPDYPSNLVVTCHRMRYKPLRELTDGEIRMAIGQQFSLPILIPLALERLESSPWLEADFYAGDLLKFVFMAKREFWIEYPDMWQRTHEIALSAWPEAVHLDDSWHEVVESDLRQTFDLFVKRDPRG